MDTGHRADVARTVVAGRYRGTTRVRPGDGPVRARRLHAGARGFQDRDRGRHGRAGGVLQSRGLLLPAWGLREGGNLFPAHRELPGDGSARLLQSRAGQDEVSGSGDRAEMAAEVAAGEHGSETCASDRERAGDDRRHRHRRGGHGRGRRVRVPLAMERGGLYRDRLRR